MLTFTYMQGVLHLHLPAARVWVPVPNLTPTPTGVRVRAMGRRPAPRAYRAIRPQVQACKLTPAHRVRPQVAIHRAQQARIAQWRGGLTPSAHPANPAAMGTPATW